VDAAFVLLNIPKELDESAMVDGCTRFQAFRRVIIPVMWPGVITTGLFSFLLAYNDFAVTRDAAQSRKTRR
jgi:ABC-type glycerol-3-phosphate transport system permease component